MVSPLLMMHCYSSSLLLLPSLPPSNYSFTQSAHPFLNTWAQQHILGERGIFTCTSGNVGCLRSGLLRMNEGSGWLSVYSSVCVCCLLIAGGWRRMLCELKTRDSGNINKALTWFPQIQKDFSYIFFQSRQNKKLLIRGQHVTRKNICYLLLIFFQTDGSSGHCIKGSGIICLTNFNWVYFLSISLL